MSLHQSAPLMESLNHVARSVWVHSSLFSHAFQDGELVTVHCIVLRTHRDPLRHVEDAALPPDGQGLSARHVEALHAQRIKRMG